jgi:hypothetical protein
VPCLTNRKSGANSPDDQSRKPSMTGCEEPQAESNLFAMLSVAIGLRLAVWVSVEWKLTIIGRMAIGSCMQQLQTAAFIILLSLPMSAHYVVLDLSRS